MYDELRIEGLHLRTIIGINSDERRDRQDSIIDLTRYVDTHLAGRSDEIEDAPVNYRDLMKRVISLVEGNSFHLIERVAEEIASVSLEERGVERVRVSVAKPGALRFARSVSVVIERDRSAR